MEYEEARLYDPLMEQKRTRPRTEMEAMRDQLNGDSRRPHHGKHFTRNILLMQNGHTTSETRKIHPPLVVKFNGQMVIG